MNSATPFPCPELSAEEKGSTTTFRDFFEHAPVAVARCNPQGVIVEMNPAFERTLDRVWLADACYDSANWFPRKTATELNCSCMTCSIPEASAWASKSEARAMGRPARSGPHGASPAAEASPTMRC